MSTTLQTLVERIGEYRYNPAGIQKVMVGMISEITGGKLDIVDPTNPVVFCLEAAASGTAAFMVENKTLNRKQYPYSAQTAEDLYPHMSDKDYVDRFAVPANSKITFLFEKAELLERLVTDAATGIRKLVIPRNTYVTVAGVVFSLQYPIEIRQMAHGGLQVVYDVDQPSPLQTLSTNVIDWIIIKSDDGTEFVGFEVEVQQFSILSRSAPVNVATGFYLTLPFEDQYCYARVWVDNGDGSFTEMATTHTDATYDIRTPTAVLKVVDNTLAVKIPQIYLTTGLLNKSVRIDIYQTKGPLSMNLGNYTPQQFVAQYQALNPAEQDQYVAPLRAFRTSFIYSNNVINGGSNAMTFEQLRSRVIRNAIGSPSLPITNVQVESALERAGYTVVKNIDNITNRVFLAARPMPDPQATELITAAAAGIGTLAIKLLDAVQLGSVVDNGATITVKPDTIYRLKRGILEFVPTAEVDALKALPPDKMALAVTDGNYMYSPFHYVFDTTNNAFAVRPYYLDDPQILTKSFLGENDTTLYQVNTGSYQIVRTVDGYKLRIQTSSSDDFKALQDSEVHVQLAFLPTGDVDRAYQTGTLVGKTDTGERLYEFDLKTNYHLGSDHELALLGFQMYDESERVVDVPLQTHFDLLYSTSVAIGSQWALSDIDALLGAFQLPPDTKAITHEQLNIRLGYFLEHLWARARSVVSENQYEKWAVDVPATYESDVYQKDPQTGAAFTIVNGELVYTLLHRAGDPVVDANGDPVYKFRKGDIKFDAYGAPIVTAGRDMARQIDIFLLEGTYYFATNQVSIDYRSELVRTVVDWLTDDLPTMGDNLLEQTAIYYYPTTTLGSVDVMFSSGLTTTINAGQAFQVTLYVKAGVYANAALRATISRKTIETIGQALASRTISMSDIIDQLREQYKDDVISIDIKGLGGASNLNVVTMLDDARRLSIRKKLVARNDETLGLEEDVTVQFVRHERSDTVVKY